MMPSRTRGRWLAAFAIATAAHPARAATTEFFDHAAFRTAAGVATVVVDFEDTGRGDGLALGAEFAEQGLTIVARDGQPMNVVTVGAGFAFPENANSAEQVLSSSIGLGGTFTDRSDSFDFVFARPKRAAGLWIGNVDPGTTAVEFLDAEGTVLASETIDGTHAGVVGTSGGPNRIFYGVVGDAPVARIRTTEGTGDSDGVSYDDVEFEAATEFFDHAAFVAQAGWRVATRDFERPAGTIAGSEYAEAAPDGLRIVHRGGAPLSIVTASGPLEGNASSGLRVLSSSILPDRSFTDGADDLDFEPVQPMRAAGLWIGNLDPGTTEVQFLDAAGAVLASEVFDSSHAGVVGDPGGANRVFYGIASDAAIAKIRAVEPAGDADGVTFDDVQFSPDLSPVPRIRVLTTNIWQGFENREVRQAKLVAWIRDFGPDLVAFQEARQSGITLALAALGYNVRHQIYGATQWTDEGVVLGSRWPIEPSLAERVSLEVDGARDYPYALVRGVVGAPSPIGRFYFLDAKPAWQTSQAPQRLTQNGILMDVVETDTAVRGGHPGAAAGLFQIIAGDFDDAPTTPSVQFLTNPPNALRDSWVEAGDGSPGYTFAQPAVGAPPHENEYALDYTGPGPYAFGDRRIDYVFARDGANREVVWHASRVVFDGKGDGWVSGHHGVFADLRPVPEPSAGLHAAAALAALHLLRRAASRTRTRDRAAPVATTSAHRSGSRRRRPGRAARAASPRRCARRGEAGSSRRASG